MKYKKNRRYQPYSFKNHHPIAKCDTSGFKIMHYDLRKQYEWYGNTLTFNGFYVHKDFLTEPNPQGKVLALPGDPFSVDTPRPFYVQPTETVTLNNTGNTVIYTIGGSPVIINPNITISQANGITDLSRGILQVLISDNLTLEDNLTITTGGSITVSGSYIIIGGVNIGTIRGGLNGTPLYIILQPGANNTNASTILQNINFSTFNSQIINKSVKFIVMSNAGINSDGGYTNILCQE
jgi:hypothetical protein